MEDATGSNMYQSFQDAIKSAVDQRCSDIHVTAEAPIFARKNGKLIPLGNPVAAYQIQKFLETILSSTQVDVLQKRRQLDFIYQLPSGCRLRGNAYYSSGNMTLCLRLVHDKIRPFETLGFPSFMSDLILNLKSGLVLISGPTGQGKSTTLASFLQLRNQKKAEHIITIEDPIEFVLKNNQSLIHQREIGRDVARFSDGLVAALREDPNVIMIGEMRDAETMTAALTLAETGHLVFGTLHTNGAVETLFRIVDSFSAENQPQIRSQLATNLRLIVSQRLVTRSDQDERILAYEILEMNSAIATLIRQDKIHQVSNAFRSENTGHSVRLEQSLAALVLDKKISKQDALENATDPEQLESILQYQESK